MKKISAIVLIITLFSNHSFAQNTESIIKQFNKSINKIDSENINTVYIANSVSVNTENGQEDYYYDKDIVNKIYHILFETDNYLYISEVIMKNDIAEFYTQNSPLIRIEDSYFGGIAEEIYISKNNKVLKTIILSEDAEFDIDSETITYSPSSQKKIVYNINLNELSLKNNSLKLSIKNNFNPFLREEIENVYLSESCVLFKPDGQTNFSFKENMIDGIYQVILKTENYFYILKVKEVTNSAYRIFTEYEPIKRISRNIFFDDTTENISIDEYGRLLKSEILYTNADSDLNEDFFILTEGDYKVEFKLINDNE